MARGAEGAVARFVALRAHDLALLGPGVEWLVGVDEVGRGPLAGPVCAAAVLVGRAGIERLEADDSKRLEPTLREGLATSIRDSVMAHALGWRTAREIDEANILACSLAAMRDAVEAVTRGLDPSRILVLVDGNRPIPAFRYAQRTVVGGDGASVVIAAASVLAKVARDALMEELDAAMPGYGFAEHKGYPTARHLAALTALGASPEHRRTFAPVRRVIENEATQQRLAFGRMAEQEGLPGGRSWIQGTQTGRAARRSRSST